jgi:hypothetical protein
MDALVYAVPLVPIAGFVIGARRAWKLSWIGAVAAAYFEARQIDVEGSWGSFATGHDDWSHWLMEVAVFCAVAFYGCFLFGLAWAHSRQQDRAAEAGDDS